MNIVARYTDVDKNKSDGATYTPKELSDFLSKNILDVFDLPKNKSIRILDPACGDGALLHSLVSNLPLSVRHNLIIFGFDTDSNAIKIATSRLLGSFPDLNINLEEKNFLEYVLNLKNSDDLLSKNNLSELFDLVIANPPYVRTQVLGSAQAQKLSRNFNLSGKVDLYYPFILGISEVLHENGVAGVITSNRFMTTKSGQDIRREMLDRFNILSIWDLGDTKLFDAAVLPSIFVAKGKSVKTTSDVEEIEFSSIYETKETPTVQLPDALKGLIECDNTVIAIPDGRAFKIQRGVLANGGTPDGVWRVTTKQTDKWLDTVEKNTWDTFSRIGKIRVGVKSTADKIFLRSDWDDLPTGRPELLKPLITRKCARRFKALIPDNPKHRKEILYPHEITETGRAAVDLSLYPKSLSYLEEHRQKLESRKYLIDAGRNWYELWVPQNPAAWPQPKVVFLDISEQPVFWMDTDGGVVNGECYWLQCKNENEQDLMWLALAVANSSFIEEFYDHRFNNKLYGGKRRFITQYVELFPLPEPTSPGAIAIVNLTKEIYAKTPSAETEQLYSELDASVWKAFGLDFKKISR